MNKRIRKKKADQLKKGRLLTTKQKYRIINKLLKTKRGLKKLAKATREPERRSLEIIGA